MKKQILKTGLLSIILFAGSINTAFSQHEKMQEGKYKPTWESLSQYNEAPEWFQNAKFGIWAHWGPQCQPEQGDWYARGMYDEGSSQYKWHVEHYGHPSVFGFKDVINDWKAEKWNPEQLVELYKKTGAQYFFAMGNHHDNMDLWDSKYQSWNSVNMGPKRDILAEWAKAAKKNKLPFGVSIHAAHAWTWYETAQRADKSGPYEGIPYDGKLTKEDGKGKWWEGYDPQDLYAQNHPLSKDSDKTSSIHGQWNWGNGADKPSEAYCENFYDRTIDMINKYNPDLVYFDDTALPLWPVSDVGLRITAHLYNKSLKENKGKQNAIVFGKVLTEDQKQAIVWDVEKGSPDQVQQKPWQTCTCIGSWHYQRSIYDNNGYKSAKTVINMLIDIVSKNGNLLLNIPIRGDGSIDDKEVIVLEGIAAWMNVNKEAIFDTRPWKIFGEGPVAETSNPIHGQGFNEGKHAPYTSEDIRFVAKKDILYAHVMSWPKNNSILVKSLSVNSKYYPNPVKQVEVLGIGNVKFKQSSEGLYVYLPDGKQPNDISLVLKIKDR